MESGSKQDKKAAAAKRRHEHEHDVEMIRMAREAKAEKMAIGGLAGWLLGRLGRRRRPAQRLELLERISLAPRQSLALVEADGRRLLVASSAEGGAAFYDLGGIRLPADRTPAPDEPRCARRVSW